MWKTVCKKCGWTSGEAYLKSVAESIGILHQQDNAGHSVVMQRVATFGAEPEAKDDSEAQGPASSKS
jgi:hypothetical protein